MNAIKETYEEDGAPGATLNFDPDSKLRFAKYITDIEQAKLLNFLLRFEFATEEMDEDKITLLFHALICLYLRKVEKEKELPKDEQTKPFCQELTDSIFSSLPNR